MDSKLLKSLTRQYYLSEALAIYDAYYRPLAYTHRKSKHREEDENRREDRPPTWVPLVFHCTSTASFKQIVASGEIKTCPNRGYLSFTEIPIGELDRMKLRHRDEDQVAIGFPRKFLQSIGFAPVLFLKHHPELRKLLAAQDLDKDVNAFVEPDDDVSAFQELRTTRSVGIEDAVWILTTTRDEKKSPTVPDLDEFTRKYGSIAVSYWHRSHQLGILGEMKYLSFFVDSADQLVNFDCQGEFYADRNPLRFRVEFPDRCHDIALRSVCKPELPDSDGAKFDIDIALSIRYRLESEGMDADQVLPHRQIKMAPKEYVK